MSKKKKPAAKATDETLSARADGMTLCSWTVGALPLINQILDRIQLESFFEKHLPVEQSADGDPHTTWVETTDPKYPAVA